MRLIIFLLFVSVVSCHKEPKVKASFVDNFESKNETLDKYWYQGKAEISTYTLDQNRYNNLHPGECVLIFVTEDFLTDLQVKNESNSKTNSTPILKSNKLKRFTTGVYDYSVMTSVFTSVERKVHPHTLKVTMSAQDWCGQSYHQLNYKNGFYESTLHSYFEKEADKIDKIGVQLLEDELFNLIRFGPEALPVGEFKMVPSMEYLRFKHKETKALEASADLKNYNGQEWNNNEVMAYHVNFPSENRDLEIYFEKEKPFKILGWDDSYPSVFDKEVRKTRARKLSESFISYWNMNQLENNKDRKQMGLH